MADEVGKLIFKVEVDADKAKEELKKTSDEIENVGESSSQAEDDSSKAFSGISAKATAMAVAIGVAFVKMAKEVAQAVDTIQEGQKNIVNATGATGSDLENLMESAQNVFRSTEESFDDVSRAIGEINTRLGLTGSQLEKTTKMFLDFADVTGQDVQKAVQDVTQIMNRWGIETENLPGLLDKLVVAGQKSGISVEELSTQLVSNAGTFKAMGYSIDEVISMLMQFELQGIDSSSVIMGMKKSFEDSAKAGTDARKDWENLLDAIKNATSETEANSLAIETFGNRIATDMVVAIRDGNLELDAFVDSLNNASGALERTDEAGKTTSDRIDEFKNRVTSALGDFGKAFAPLVDNFLPSLATTIENALGFVTSIVSAFTSNKSAVTELSSAVDVLTSAMADYNSITNTLTENVDNMTEAERRLYEIQQERARLAVDEAMSNVASTYVEATAEIDNQASAVERLKGKLEALGIAMDAEKNGVEGLYEARAELLMKQREGITLSEKEQAVFDELTNLIMTRSAQGINYSENLRDSYVETYEKLLEETLKYEQSSLELESSIANLAIAVQNGLLDLDKYRDIYPELVSEIERFLSKNEEATSTLEDSSEATQNAGESISDMAGNFEEASDTVGESANSLAEYFSSLTEEQKQEIEEIGNLNSSLGKLLPILNDYLSEIDTAIGKTSSFHNTVSMLVPVLDEMAEALGRVNSVDFSLPSIEDMQATISVVREYTDALVESGLGGVTETTMGNSINEVISDNLSAGISGGSSSVNVNNRLNAVIEVDGTQLGIATLKNIDNAGQFVVY